MSSLRHPNLKRLKTIAETICSHPVLGHWPTMRAKTDSDFLLGMVTECERLSATVQALIRELTSIAEHNHQPVDRAGNLVILEADCPACNPRRTARLALERMSERV
jgi:hypothetical protein